MTAQKIRAGVLQAIGRNRRPGFHFPGHFLDIDWTGTDRTKASMRMPDGPHVHDARGQVDIMVLGLFVDMALGSAARLHDGYHGRLATTCLHMELTGVDLCGDLLCESWLRGRMANTEAEYLLTEATVSAQGMPACHASATFVRLPSKGRGLALLPWQLKSAPSDSPAAEVDLNDEERGILRRCDEALSDESVPFIRRFWAGPSKPAANPAMLVGPHVGNRVGHAQGGIMLGFAAAGGSEAVSRDLRLSNATGWFARPALPGTLSSHTSLLHSGRTTALASTTLRFEGDLVLSVMTQHVHRGA